ncbi:MAG: hypothetical protein LBL84_03315 [Candidatus Nomurabacteria bacterium]|jgi:hypothetical protein|nr:hypothetical protein [Candidatus Nomurabacteria bacterium]
MVKKLTIVAVMAAVLVIATATALLGCKSDEPLDHIGRVEQEQTQREEEQANLATQADKDAQQLVNLGPCYEPGGLDYSGGTNTDRNVGTDVVRWYGTGYNEAGQKIWIVQWSPRGTDILQKTASEPNRIIIIPDDYLALGSGARSWGDPPAQYVGKIILVCLVDENGDPEHLNSTDNIAYLDGWGWTVGVEY